MKILFICHGNICRSPMAEYIFKWMVEEARLSYDFEIASAATSREEIGNDIYPPAKKILRQNSIPFEGRRARQITEEDLEYYDYIIAMEKYNIANMVRMFGDKVSGKVTLLMSYAGLNQDVSDPWYTGDFEKAYEDIEKGCKGLLGTVLLGSLKEEFKA